MSENAKTSEKKYWWLKLKSDWYETDMYGDIIRKAGGDKGFLHQSIYLRMLTMAIETEGHIKYEDNMPYTPRLLAIKIGVETKDITAVLDIAKEIGAIVFEKDGTMFLPALLKNMVGSERASAARQRKHRAKSTQVQKHEPSQSDDTSSLCHTETREKRLEYDDEEHLRSTKEPSRYTSSENPPAGLSICLQSYKQSFGKPCNPAQKKYIVQRIGLGSDPEIIAHAFEVAAERNAQDIIAYVNTCLEDWRIRGWKTLNEVEDGLVEHEFIKNNKEIPLN